MEPDPHLGEKVFIRHVKLPKLPVRTGTVTEVGYRFFTVTTDDTDVDIQFRLGNWVQRIHGTPDFTISRTAP